MKYSKSNIILQKSIDAAKAAIELYNKPIFPYRNECFSILMINAWELALKAKKVKENSNKMTSIYIKERVKNKKGVLTNKKRYITNRTGNFSTMSITDLIKSEISDKNLQLNLNLLLEIRDNAIHCFNKPKLMEKHYLEIITATLSSYQKALSLWFAYDITDNMLIIPIGFNLPERYDLSDVTLKEEKNILKYISEQRNKSDNESSFDVALNVEVKFIKTSADNTNTVRFDPNGLPIHIDSEEVFKRKYPISFDVLKKKLNSRYSDFKLNKKFWDLKKELETNSSYAGIRYLDYYTQKGTKKTYYNTEVFKEFDKEYTQLKEARNG